MTPDYPALDSIAPLPSGKPTLHADLIDLANRWATGGGHRNAREQDAVSGCSAELLAVLDKHPGDDTPTEAARYALVEQMGHRATIASVKEVTFCGKPALEVTDLKTSSVHVVFPDSLYEITWLTESDARARSKPWTAQAITTGNRDPWGVAESDLDDEDTSAEDAYREAGIDATPEMHAPEQREYDREGNEL